MTPEVSKTPFWSNNWSGAPPRGEAFWALTKCGPASRHRSAQTVLNVRFIGFASPLPARLRDSPQNLANHRAFPRLAAMNRARQFSADLTRQSTAAAPLSLHVNN